MAEEGNSTYLANVAQKESNPSMACWTTKWGEEVRTSVLAFPSSKLISFITVLGSFISWSNKWNESKMQFNEGREEDAGLELWDRNMDLTDS